MQSISDELAQKTLRYWKLSSSWNGQGAKISCGTALNITKNLAITLNPYRPLYRVLIKTEDEIIRNQRRKSAKDSPPNLIPLPLRNTQ